MKKGMMGGRKDGRVGKEILRKWWGYINHNSLYTWIKFPNSYFFKTLNILGDLIPFCMSKTIIVLVIVAGVVAVKRKFLWPGKQAVYLQSTSPPNPILQLYSRQLALTSHPYLPPLAADPTDLALQLLHPPPSSLSQLPIFRCFLETLRPLQTGKQIA